MGIVGLLVLGVCRAGAWDLFTSFSLGYTHYEAQDLNKILVLLEETTQEQGFNPYQVNQFDGHPQRALVIGWMNGPWRIGVETEFWVEEFHQAEVPFDLEEAGREYRITCNTLRDPNYRPQSLYGCVDAKEEFNFLPVTAQVAYGLPLGRFGRVEAGYGLGVMAGSATIRLKTDYFGEGAIENDEIQFDVWPGVNPVQKAWLGLEFTPWKFVGLDARFGYRMSKLDRAELRNQSGESRIFSTVFPEAKDGARLYIQSFPDTAIGEKIYVGTESDAGQRALHDGSHFDLVQGDFTGWFVALKLNLYWRDL